MRTSFPLAAIILASAVAAAPAAAQDVSANAPVDSVFDHDHITIGAAGTYGPSYLGSNNYRFSGIPAIQGRIAFVTINPTQNGLALDLIPAPKDSKISLSLGPSFAYSMNRHSSIKDPVVRAAGKLKSAFDVGVNGGITAHQLLDPYDSLTFSGNIRWNVNNSYKGTVITPAVSYVTPLSRAMIASVGAFANHVSTNYANYYFGVSPLQSVRSGLPQYVAGKGWSDVGANILVGYDLGGDLTNGGFAVFVLGSYSKLLDDAKRTPYTAIRGSSNQFTAGLGVAYTFGL